MHRNEHPGLRLLTPRQSVNDTVGALYLGFRPFTFFACPLTIALSLFYECYLIASYSYPARRAKYEVLPRFLHTTIGH